LVYNNATTSTKTNEYQLIIEECRPVLGALSYDDANLITRNVMAASGQTLVQNESELKVTVASLSLKYGATGTIKIKIGTEEEKNITAGTALNMGKFNYSTNQVMTATITDSRGLTASTSTTVKFMEYAPPKLSASITRDGGYGTDATLIISASYTPLGNKNT
jgi:hypothetical protein